MDGARHSNPLLGSAGSLPNGWIIAPACFMDLYSCHPQPSILLCKNMAKTWQNGRPLADTGDDSLLVEEDGDDDADDEDHGEHGAHHPDEAVRPRLHLTHLVHHLRGHDRVRVRAGRKHSLEKEQKGRHFSSLIAIVHPFHKNKKCLYYFHNHMSSNV